MKSAIKPQLRYAFSLLVVVCISLDYNSAVGETPRSGRGRVLIDDDFTNPSHHWKKIEILGSGQLTINNGRLQLSVPSQSSVAAYCTKPLSGHFYMEVDFDRDAHAGLALFGNKGGEPDLRNYSLITIEDHDGVPQVKVRDIQNGTPDVLDNTGKATKSRFRVLLDGTVHSVPFTGTNQRFRIMRHANERFVHFYYSVKKSIRGKDATDWMELAPSKEWKELGDSFFMGLVAIDGSVSFDNAFAMNKPIDDVDDSRTGFKATRREFNWSGYHGDALVVTFDQSTAPLTQGKRKFVFWDQCNYVPAWMLDDELMFTCEFVETWGGGSPGCYEPMSDRLKRFSTVSLEHDGPDYKLVHWQYALVDADYKFPDNGQGKQIPVCDEYYKIYPDGTILRKIRYKPKLDSEFRNWHELTELIVIAGKNTDPADHLARPSLTIWPLSQERLDFIPMNGDTDYEKEHNDLTLLAAHFSKHPSIVCAFCDRTSTAETFAGYPIAFYKTWHDQLYHMSHWPINKEPYHTDAFKSESTWSEQVKHSSLAGAGVYGGSQWEDQTKIDDRDGRKYRQWISIISLAPNDELSAARDQAKIWVKNPWTWSPKAPLR